MGDLMGNRAYKISFLGDITLDRPMLNSGRKPDGSYDYSGVFDVLSEQLSDSDCVICNLETLFAGQKAGYNPGVVSYNSPDAFIKEIRKLNCELILTTANNHCLDLGTEGEKRTLALLDDYDIHHTGVFIGSERRYIVQQVGDIKVAFVSFTSVMNNRENGLPHAFGEFQTVNCLFSERARSTLSTKQKIKRLLPSKYIRRFAVAMRKLRGVSMMKPFSDDFDIPASDIEAIDRAGRLLTEARAHSDVVVACVHTGGQFNVEPGRYTRALFEKLGENVDFIVGNHPHVVQQILRKATGVWAYSLGSVNLSTSADYIIPGRLSEYSIALHLYLRQDCFDASLLEKATFSVLKAVEDANGFVRTMPVAQLYSTASEMEKAALLKDVGVIYQRCMGTGEALTEIASEYVIV